MTCNYCIHIDVCYRKDGLDPRYANNCGDFMKYAEQEPTDEWQNGYDMAWEEAKVFYEQEPCDDAISRQAVLEMAYDMSEIDGEHFTEPCMVVDVEDIQKLPPITQKPIECDEAVSRRAVIKLVKGCNSALEEPRIFNSHNSGVVFEQYINELPSVRPQEQTGHWIKKDGYSDCSECGSHIVTGWDYCPKCGARMVEPQESEGTNETDN